MAIALSMAFTVTPVPASTVYVIEMANQVSAGKNFAPRSAYKKVAVVAAAGASPANVLAAWNALYGALIAGTKIFFRLSAISTVTGERSGFLYGSQVVT